MQCPMCLEDNQLVIGGIILLTPAMISDPDKAPIAGRACNRCLGVVAATLDMWRNGGILNFIEKLKVNRLVQSN